MPSIQTEVIKLFQQFTPIKRQITFSSLLPVDKDRIKEGQEQKTKSAEPPDSMDAKYDIILDEMFGEFLQNRRLQVVTIIMMIIIIANTSTTCVVAFT